MAHLLIIELPGGNDTDLIEAALRARHSFVFLTQNLEVYQQNAEVDRWVQQASAILVSPTFAAEDIDRQVMQAHQQQPFEAVLCLLDIRLIETATLAQRLQLPHLSVDAAKLLRDKFSVRDRLQAHGIAQPPFALATSNAEIASAIQTVGFPLLIKPSDGYGSQNIITLHSEDEWQLHQSTLQQLLPLSTDYGLGVVSNDRLLIERYMSGVLIGCDTFTLNGQHHLLGINEKLMFPPPSFAIRGGCFTPSDGQWQGLTNYLFQVLDAVGFQCGAAHIEIMVTAEGPQLIELNPRLVGAKIARLMSYALATSVHEALIELHLGRWPIARFDPQAFKPAVSRWLVADAPGTLRSLTLPAWQDDAIQCVEILKHPGDPVSPPYENAHRLGYVMTCASQREYAETMAEKFISDTKVVISEH